MENKKYSIGDYIYTKDSDISRIVDVEDEDMLLFYTSNHKVYKTTDILEVEHYYIELINKIIGLDHWKTKNSLETQFKILNLKFEERTFRQEIEKYNKLYANHMVNKYVAHSDKGYVLTDDVNLIKESLIDYRKRAIDQLVKYSKGMRAIGENYNFKMQVENDSFIFVEGV